MPKSVTHPAVRLARLMGAGWGTAPSVQKGEMLLQHNRKTVCYVVQYAADPAVCTARTPGRALNLRRVPVTAATGAAIKAHAAKVAKTRATAAAKRGKKK